MGWVFLTVMGGAARSSLAPGRQDRPGRGLHGGGATNIECDRRIRSEISQTESRSDKGRGPGAITGAVSY